MSTKNEDLFMLLYCKAEATGSCEPSGCLLSPPKTPSCVSCKVHWVTAVPAGLLLMGEEMMGLLGIVSLSSDPPGYCAQERSQKPSSRLCLHSETLCFLLLFRLSLFEAASQHQCAPWYWCLHFTVQRDGMKGPLCS